MQEEYSLIQGFPPLEISGNGEENNKDMYEVKNAVVSYCFAKSKQERTAFFLAEYLCIY